MKPLLILALLLALTGNAAAQDVEQRVKEFRNSKKFSIEYDKFTDESRIAVGPFDISDSIKTISIYSLRMTARFIFSGKRLTNPAEDFALLFRSRSREWQFLRNHDLYMLIDGERVTVGEAEYDGNVESGGVSEFMRYLVSPDLVKRIAGAKQVELKIGRWEVTLKDEHKEAFRDLFSLSR